jgi:hypothetical protein
MQLISFGGDTRFEPSTRVCGVGGKIQWRKLKIEIIDLGP